MAFATKYKTSIMNWNGDTITAEIQEDNFAGSLEEFTPVGKIAIKIEHQVNVNVKESYIVPSLASIRVYTNNEWDLNELLYATDRQFKVVIKNGSNELFIGWVIPGVNHEDYTTGQYVILIRAIDGLADLKRIPYLDSGSLYDDFQSPLEIIQNCLEKTGFITRSLWENTDIYAASGMTVPDYGVPSNPLASPLNQSFIHSKAYGETIESIESCWDVLEHIMQAFHSRLYGFSHSSTDFRWTISKLDKLADDTNYRAVTSAGTYTTSVLYSPSLTMGTDVQHVNGKGQISIKQGYKEVNITGLRGIDFSLLNGQNFKDDDFPTASTLTNWGELDKTDIVSTWELSGISKETINGDIMAGVERYSADHASAFVGTTSVDNGGGKVQINSSLLITSDHIIIGIGDYKGIWKVTAIDAGVSFDINADYTEDQQVQWRTINLLVGIEYDGTNDIIDNSIIVDSAFDRLKFEFEYFLENTVTAAAWDNIVVVVVAWINATDYKLLDNDGNWNDDSTTDFPAIILYHNDDPGGTNKFSVEASLSSSTGNFYSAGSPKLYVGLYGNSNLADSLKYNSVKISVLGGADKSSTTAIDTDYVDSLDVDFFHTDGDGGDNDRLRHLHPIYDDATPKEFINSWQQDGATADNLEDIIEANLAASYDKNSQIWSGMIEGDINISNVITDPFNFTRTFQIQKLVRNLETDFCQISMIEIVPQGFLT